MNGVDSFEGGGHVLRREVTVALPMCRDDTRAACDLDVQAVEFFASSLAFVVVAAMVVYWAPNARAFVAASGRRVGMPVPLPTSLTRPFPLTMRVLS